MALDTESPERRTNHHFALASGFEQRFEQAFGATGIMRALQHQHDPHRSLDISLDVRKKKL